MRRCLPTLVCLIVLGGCGLAPAPAPPSVPAVAPTSSPSQASPSPSATATLATLASRTVPTEGGSAEIAVHELKVSGRLMVLTWSVTNHGDDWEVKGAFGDGEVQRSPNGSFAPNEMLSRITDGVFILDGTAGQRYLPARDSMNGCVCSHTDRLELARDQRVYFEAVFKAVPDAVSSVTVSIPLAGALAPIPVLR